LRKVEGKMRLWQNQRGDSILEGTQPGAVRDAGIIASSQKKHYEIATYGTLSAFCKTLEKIIDKRW
jgi:ferritin-like metal-binding protein YciE